MAKKAPAKERAPRSAGAKNPVYGTTAGASNPNMWHDFLSVPGVQIGKTKIVQNPDPTLRLRQTIGRGQAAYDDMLDKDPHLAGLFDTRFHAVVSLPREVLAADEHSSLSNSMAETVTRVLEGIDEFEESLEDLLSCRINGYRVAEIEWERWADGTVGVRKLHAVPSGAILFDADGLPRLKTKAHQFDGEELPDRKFIVMRNKGTSMNPYGVGLGRSLWWYSWFKREGLKFWAVFIEKFGQPTVLGKHPAQWTDAQKDEFVNVLKTIASETAIRIPMDVEVDLLEATRNGSSSSQESFCKWLDDAMSKRVLGQDMSSSAKDTGLNSSQGTLAGEVRQDIKERDARALKRVLQDTLVRWIVDFNYGMQDPQDYPKAHIHAEPPEDLNSLVDLFEKSMAIGIRVSEKYARSRLGIPEPEAGDTVLNDVQAQQLREAMPAGLGGFGDPVGGGGEPGQ